MEKRIISISLGQARAWHKGSNETLKVLALQAYTEEELTPSVVKEALSYIAKTSYTVLPINCLNPRHLDTLQATAKLMDIADYLNKGWKKEEGNTGYFITASSKANTAYQDNKGFTVVKHEYVKYPLVYFRCAEDAWAVINYFYVSELQIFTNF